jgi:leucyl aminopeptidase
MISNDTIPKINISNRVNISLGCSIIPVLLTYIEKESLKNHLSKYISIPDTYNSLLKHIEDNMKNNNLHMVSLTIETEANINKTKSSNTSNISSTKKTKKHKKLNEKLNNNSKSNSFIDYKLKNTSHIHQIFIISINNRNYNKENDYELLEIARVSGNAIFNTLKNNQISYTNIIDTVGKISRSKNSNDNTLFNTKFIQCLIEGLLLSAYKFLKYKTEFSLTKTKDKYELSLINIVIPSKNNSIKSHNTKKNHVPNHITKHIKILQNQIKTVFLARDLINEPANESKILRFIKIVKEFIKENKIPVILEVLEKSDLEKLGMGLILGVGKGSSIENSPKVIIIKYNCGSSSGCGKKSQPEYVLMGKGITFDTGGLDLKGSKSMLEMKTDLSGAATVISFILGYAMSGGKKSIYTICPFAENSIGPNSTKPSDVIKSYNGRTVEIANTDAEGRLVLADCLSYASNKFPNATIIDFATLTGQQESVSGKLFSCILSTNSDKDVEKLIKKGREINEPLVELPLIEKSVDNLESYVADIKNVSFTNSADIIMSALFMRQFVMKDTKWIHIDIAGPSYKVDKVIKYASPEASGVGVRLLFSFFE